MTKREKKTARMRRLLTAQQSVETSVKQTLTELRDDYADLEARRTQHLELMNDPMSIGVSLAPLMSIQLSALLRRKELLVQSIAIQGEALLIEKRRSRGLQDLHNRARREEERALEEDDVRQLLEVVLGR